MSKLVNVGSLCIDFVYSVPLIAAAGETVASIERQVFSGGKGLNQSIAAARAGVSVHHFGAVGEDGDSLVGCLTDNGVDTTGVVRLAGASGHAVIQVDAQGRNAIVISGGTNRQLSEAHASAAVAALEAGDWMLLQNETNHVGQIMQEAADRGMSVALNVAPPDSRIFDYPIERLGLLVANEHEAMYLAQNSAPELAFQALKARCPDTHLVMTRGSEGLMFSEAGQADVYSMGAYAVRAVDETAAGDAFVGYVLAGLVQSRPLVETLVRASGAGACAVTQAGAAPSVPEARAVDQLLNQQHRLVPSQIQVE